MKIATTLMPAFLASMGVAAAWLGLIEGVSDGLSSFAKMGSGYYTDKLCSGLVGWAKTRAADGWRSWNPLNGKKPSPGDEGRSCRGNLDRIQIVKSSLDAVGKSSEKQPPVCNTWM